MLGFSSIKCCLRICFCLLLPIYTQLLASLSVADQSREPEFAEQVPNITVAVGREAVLSCVVDHLSPYAVAWIKVDTQTIYTIGTHVVSHSPRISTSHNGHRIWNLHIREVQENDKGYYMCQINTDPMKHQVGYIDIVVPPDIIYEQSSSDMTVTEGSNASLYCKAKGYPKPNITWTREDGTKIIVRNNNKEKVKVQMVEGEILNFTKVSRKQTGAYLCIASNGVPPSISKRIFLQVNIKPKVKVPMQVLGAPIGSEVIMECHIEASPRPVNYWCRENGEYIISSNKYHVTELIESYEITFALKIREVEAKDFGTYNCTSKNVLGESIGSVQLIDPSPTSLNRSIASQKALDSYKHSQVNQFEKFQEKMADPARSSSSAIQSTSVNVVKSPSTDRGLSNRPDSNGNRRSNPLRWSFLLHFLLLFI
ncbi:hypothetical protein CHUAL_000571 [Chamberlinius hualienensis]